MKESEIQKAILDHLSWMKILAWRNQQIPVPIRRGKQIVGLRRADPHTVGMPDILCCIRGQLVGIEVKTDKGKLSEEQKEWRDKLSKNGALWLEARSVDDVVMFLHKNSMLN